MGKVYRKNLLANYPERISYLPPREQRILRMRYGIGEPETPLKEIAARFGVCEQTIRRYEAAAIRKIERLGDTERAKCKEQVTAGIDTGVAGESHEHGHLNRFASE